MRNQSSEKEPNRFRRTLAYVESTSPFSRSSANIDQRNVDKADTLVLLLKRVGLCRKIFFFSLVFVTIWRVAWKDEGSFSTLGEWGSGPERDTYFSDDWGLRFGLGLELRANPSSNRNPITPVEPELQRLLFNPAIVPSSVMLYSHLLVSQWNIWRIIYDPDSGRLRPQPYWISE